MNRILAITLILFLSSLGRAFAEDSALIRDLNQKLSLLESKMTRVSNSQDEIIQKQSEIDKELANLRIWIRRHRG